MYLLVGLCLFAVAAIDARTQQNSEDLSPQLRNLLKSIYFDSRKWESAVFTDDSKLKKDGVDTTYGEILPESVANISAAFKDVEQEETEFWDLGCGVGRMVIQEFLEDGWKRAVGVELVRIRFDVACTAMSRMVLAYYNESSEIGAYVREKVGPGAIRTVENEGEQGEKVCFGNDEKEMCLYNEDMTIVPGLENAGGVFMCSTCFPERLLKHMMDERFSKMAPGSVIMSLKALPQEGLLEDGMELVSTQAHAMTWSESDTVDVYKRLKDHSVITERAQVVTN